MSELQLKIIDSSIKKLQERSRKDKGIWRNLLISQCLRKVQNDYYTQEADRKIDEEIQSLMNGDIQPLDHSFLDFDLDSFLSSDSLINSSSVSRKRKFSDINNDCDINENLPSTTKKIISYEGISQSVSANKITKVNSSSDSNQQRSTNEELDRICNEILSVIQRQDSPKSSKSTTSPLLSY